MAAGKKLRLLIGRLKDGTSIIMGTLSAKHTIKLQSAVLRATSHNLSAPPSDRRFAEVLFLAGDTCQAASACVSVLMDRLNATRSVSVALKCLFTVHAIIRTGSFVLKDQLYYHPSFGGRNFLNLSKFRDFSELKTRELSSWVRWYAAVLEQNLMVYRSVFSITEEKVLKISILVEKLEVLAGFVEKICDFPDSLNLQKIGLVYDIVMVVSEDYRPVQHEILRGVLRLRIGARKSSFEELDLIVDVLKRLENCRERLHLLFVNRKRFDGLWELISETKMMILEMLKEKEMKTQIIQLI